MKYLLFITLIFLLFSCKPTSPSGDNDQTGSDRATLVITNMLSESAHLTIIDSGAVALDFDLGLSAGYTLTWFENENVFDVLDGVISIFYNTNTHSYDTKIHLELGKVIYYDLNDDNATLTIFNNTLLPIDFTMDDGSFSEINFTVQLNETKSYSWDINDPLFTDNEGILVLDYQNEDDENINSIFVLHIGDNEFYQIDELDYILKISNATNSDAWYELNNYPVKHLSTNDFELYFENHFTESYEAVIEYSGYHVFSDYQNIYITEFTQTNFDIQADGGAIELSNSSDLTLTAAYISPSADSLWGYNDLGDFLEPFESAIWTVEDGYWDVLIRDYDSNEYYIFNSAVWLDATLNLNFPTDFIETKSDKSQKNKVINDLDHRAMRIELN
ncbi:MAG: hypothetical protein K8S23_02310 [Candidatus Cloacimonetes bacterium]|nr:hypothetical protein [Candidatus Cloacimonadota bacterium]